MNPIPSKAFYSLTFKFILLGLLTTVVVLQLCILLRPPQAIPEPGYRAQLSNLVWKLHDKGLEFRVYSQRPDGLWDDGVYLTTTDKTFREIARVPANPDLLDQWGGTVSIYRMNSLPSPDSPYDRILWRQGID
jgi:hypothetical protein